MESVIIFLGEKSPNADTVFWKRNIPSQIPCIWEKLLQKGTENLLFGDGVATFMPTVYSFQSFLK
jgi:hypothetical protein